MTADEIIGSVIQDAQSGTTNRATLLDYVDRVQQRILRDTQWVFLRSAPKKFITQPGAQTYFIGSGTTPAGAVNTGLNLTDVWSIWLESVFNKTTNMQLLADSSSILNTLSNKNTSVGLPRSFTYDFNNPNSITLTPAPDVNNSYQPVPRAPICTTAAGGTLPSRTYYVGATYVDSAGNEGTLSVLPVVIYVPADSLVTAASPLAEIASALTVSYSSWNCYIGTSPESLTKQNAAPIAIDTAFTEPPTGLIAGTTAPQTSSLTPLRGYVIEFRYYQQRTAITQATQTLQVPDNYRDVVIAGVNFFVSLYTNRGDDMDRAGVWKQEFLDGIRQIRKDLNLNFRNTDFIGPDRATQPNSNDAFGSALFS